MWLRLRPQPLGKGLTSITSGATLNLVHCKRVEEASRGLDRLLSIATLDGVLKKSNGRSQKGNELQAMGSVISGLATD
jgi:hypothetical protein